MSIPVIGNGDVTSPESAARLVQETGCDGIMVGRAAQGNPWIFNQITHYLDTGEILPKPTLEDVKTMIVRHAQLQIRYKGEITAMREMRKHVAWYTAGYPHSARLRAAVNEIETLDELLKMIEGWK